MKKMLIELVEELGLSYRTHDSHGFYMDVWVGNRKLMVDPTPETVWSRDDRKLVKRYKRGMVIVRDLSMHHYDSPTQLAPDFDATTTEGVAALKAFLADTERVRRARSYPSTLTDAVSLLGSLA